MIYVVSNLHGNYAKFKELLKVISFKDSDIMYVLGDIVDYSIKVGEQFLRVQKGRNDVRLNEGEICGLKFKHPFWYDAD